jgi:hypothetical protein
MPCYSTIKTKLSDGARIMKALEILGFDLEVPDPEGMGIIVGKKNMNRITFSKSGKVYSVSGDAEELVSISRKYAEIGVRDWARRAGYSVTENDGQKMTLVNRRG